MLLTIDIGTSSFKSALWNYDGKRQAYAESALSMISDGIKFETNSYQWLKAFEQCCNKLGNLKQVEVIVISGNGPTLVPVSEAPQFAVSNTQPKVCGSNARLWLDRRAEKYQNEVSELMGGYVNAGFFLPKILAIKNEEAELYNKTKFFLGCPEFLAFALTGNAKNVFPSDGFDRWFWNDSVLEKLNMDASKFPAFIRPGDQFGTLLPHVTRHFGFSKNIPVISGGPDFFAAILGAGVTEPGQVCDRTGSSEGINLCSKKYVNDSRLMSYAHPVKPWWNLSGVINTCGKAIEWGSELLGLNCYDDFFTLAKTSKPGSNGLIFRPYLAGERASFNKQRTNALWSGITLSAGRSEFANSILEGIAFAVRDVLSIMEESGEKAAHLHVTGGLAGCQTLNQIKADITGLEVLEGVHKEAELLGLAIIGVCSLGKYSSYVEASGALCRIEKRYEPNHVNEALYNEMFEEYLSADNKSIYLT